MQSSIEYSCHVHPHATDEPLMEAPDLPDPAMMSEDAKNRELLRLRQAMQDIASFDDTYGNRDLYAFGSYRGFDEPSSVRKAREALSGR